MIAQLTKKQREYILWIHSVKMASRRIAASTIDWAEFAKKIPLAQRPAFNALKNKQDGYVRTIAALPEKLPDIDFANYKAKIQVKGEYLILSLAK